MGLSLASEAFKKYRMLSGLTPNIHYILRFQIFNFHILLTQQYCENFLPHCLCRSFSLLPASVFLD